MSETEESGFGIAAFDVKPHSLSDIEVDTKAEEVVHIRFLSNADGLSGSLMLSTQKAQELAESIDREIQSR